VLLEYALGDKRSFVWAVTNSSLKYFPLPPRATVEQAARQVYELLTEGNKLVKGETDVQQRERLAAAEEAYTKAADTLSRMIVGPVAQELGSKRVVIVADGTLQYVPFAALPDPIVAVDGAGTERPPLVFGHEILSLPSASVLAVMREEFRDRKSALKAVAVIADPVLDKDDERLKVAAAAAGGRNRPAAPKQGTNSLAQRALRSLEQNGRDGFARLPFSRREARAIMDVVSDEQGLLALDFRASRATVMSGELANYRIIHFATHGLLNSEHPEFSGIVLSLFDERGRDQEGFLGLNEIYNLNLPADLVVLSACQTALGKDVRGEGLIGLTRGFMYAGAERVIATLWKVDDSATAELMQEFYRAMFGKGMKPLAALRAAQIHMWQQRRWHSPYYWAAFSLQGEWK
jgi:CHAT domain-containing protein